MQTPGLVAVLVYDGLCAFEYGIAVEAFGLPRPEFDFPWYEFALATVEPGPIRMLGGMTATVSAGLDTLAQARTIVVPGWRHHQAPVPPALLAAVQQAAANGARFLTICSGAFVLAEAGLLDGKRATTHWRYREAFRARFPRVQLEPDVLYVDAGQVITSAGSAAGIDACLHLIRRDFGSKIANQVARRMVVPPHREGGQAQYVEAPLPAHPGRGIGEAMDWARSRLTEPISVPDFAKQAAMSERTFLRRFQQAAGMAPKDWLLRERLYRSQALLESTSLSLAQIAEACGIASLETYRAAFRRVFGVTPARYRERFRRPTVSAQALDAQAQGAEPALSAPPI